MAYDYSEAAVRKILEENPSIEVLIDLHRDGVAEDTRLVTEINGKQTARIMFFNGLSRTRTNGEISYLKNPYIQDNLAFFISDASGGGDKESGFYQAHISESLPVQSAHETEVASDRGGRPDEYGGRDDECHGTTCRCAV